MLAAGGGFLRTLGVFLLPAMSAGVLALSFAVSGAAVLSVGWLGSMFAGDAWVVGGLAHAAVEAEYSR